MNVQTSDAVHNALNSDNFQDTLITIRSKIFAVEAQSIKETVNGTTNINSEYKEYDIAGKLHESYTAPYEVNQQAVKCTITSNKFASDKYVANANYKQTRKGNTIKLVTLGSTQICIGINSAHRVGLLGTTAMFKGTFVLGATAKITLLGVSLFMRNRVNSKSTVHVSFVGVSKERCTLLTHLVVNRRISCTLKKSAVINKRGLLTTVGGNKTELYK